MAQAGAEGVLCFHVKPTAGFYAGFKQKGNWGSTGCCGLLRHNSSVGLAAPARTRVWFELLISSWDYFSLMQHQIKVQSGRRKAPLPLPSPCPSHCSREQQLRSSPHLAGGFVAQFLGDGVECFQLGSLLLARGEDDSVGLPAKRHKSWKAAESNA